MWEYKYVYIKYKQSQELINELNKYGLENWEVISFKETEPNGNYSKYIAKILMKKQN